MINSKIVIDKLVRLFLYLYDIGYDYGDMDYYEYEIVFLYDI